MFCAFLVAGVVALSPPPKVNSPEGRTAWEVYAQNLLPRLYPDQAASMGERPVVVVQGGDVPYAQRHPRYLVVSFSLVELAEDEAEFAAVIAHELSHGFLGHEDTQLWSAFLVPAGDDMVLLEKQELEADADSLIALRRAKFPPCAAVRMLRHFIDGYHMRERPDKPYWALTLRREAALMRDCTAK